MTIRSERSNGTGHTGTAIAGSGDARISLTRDSSRPRALHEPSGRQRRVPRRRRPRSPPHSGSVNLQPFLQAILKSVTYLHSAGDSPLVYPILRAGIHRAIRLRTVGVVYGSRGWSSCRARAGPRRAVQPVPTLEIEINVGNVRHVYHVRRVCGRFRVRTVGPPEPPAGCGGCGCAAVGAATRPALLRLRL